MNVSEFAYLARRPYSTLLQEDLIFGTLFVQKQLPFEMQAQTQSNWCWAATAVSVSRYFWRWSTWTQCRVANAELGQRGCCGDPSQAACNVPWYLDRSLTRTRNFVSITGAVSFEQVRAEIDKGRPVGARIGWSGGGGHFMVIYGYSTIGGGEYFDIDDPIYGKSHLPVSEFTSGYQGTGSWTHTYFLKSYFRMPFDLPIPTDLILRRIWELRPLLKLKGGTGAPAPGDIAQAQTANIGIAQRIYAVGLADLLGAPDVQPEAVGLRVYEVEDDAPRAFFDISEDGDARLLQMSAARAHLEPFARALAVALSQVKEDEVRELRLLRVPALNFEALWIASEDPQVRDVLVPLRSVGRFALYQPVELADALVLLREAAKPLANMDDLMGA
ncbi:C39 family peptidase [Massilia sp. PAMC28688]|uniref:papain-like cysteine protease family protein n=1 Tax=Massilia sp. PAMC28688 TaxID=2861283 RepID=UPI001C629C15|nr:papain-like cysteine protease family protein [Massilia sp. PAMC28688]QYF93256.1 C39 family peptidase [Massilia sp. PAMC28688]